jgi:hypothetical protein
MYFHASYTLSPAILHILPQHFTMVSPLDRQLNTTIFKYSKNSFIISKIYYYAFPLKCLVLVNYIAYRKEIAKRMQLAIFINSFLLQILNLL